MNAHNHGRDNATAAADLISAFVLISVKSGWPPDRALAVSWEKAKEIVAILWPDERAN